ncbi:unnamed protein product [Camellia sinensis]
MYHNNLHLLLNNQDSPSVGETSPLCHAHTNDCRRSITPFTLQYRHNCGKVVPRLDRVTTVTDSYRTIRHPDLHHSSPFPLNYKCRQMEQSQMQSTPSKTLHKRGSKQTQQQSANVHKATWDSNTVWIFLQLVIKELDSGFKGSFHTMTMHGYRVICKAFQECTNKVHDIKQLQTKYALLKKDWQLWSWLMDSRHGPTGISYNEATGLIQAFDDWWAHNEKVDKNAIKFKTKPLEHMDLMRRVYEGATTIGKYAWTPGAAFEPVATDEHTSPKDEEDCEDSSEDDMSVTVHTASSAIHADDTPTSGRSKCKFSRTTHLQRKKGQSEGASLLASSMENPASSVKLQQREVRVYDDYGDSTQELIDKCVTRLYSLEGLDLQDPLIVFGLMVLDNLANQAIMVRILTDVAVISWLQMKKSQSMGGLSTANSRMGGCLFIKRAEPAEVDASPLTATTSNLKFLQQEMVVETNHNLIEAFGLTLPQREYGVPLEEKAMATTVHNDLPIDDDDVVEVGRRNSDPWPQANEALFITLMDEEVKTKSSKIIGTFTKQAWNRLRDQMNAKTQYQYNAHQLWNKYNQMRIMFNKFTALLKHTSVGWDSQRLIIITSDDVWEALYKVNSHAKRFRKKWMVYYHELSRILGDTSATGKLAHPSSKSPSESSASSDTEFKVKNEDLDALQIDSDSDNDNGDGQGKCKGKSKMAEMSENSKRKVDLMEKRLTSASVTNVGDDSGFIEGGSTASRSLLKECMALLHAMEEIPVPAYTKAVNKLASNPIIREVFVDMPASRIRDWVLNL